LKRGEGFGSPLSFLFRSEMKKPSAKKVPKGSHMMPNGKIMKNSSMRKGKK